MKKCDIKHKRHSASSTSVIMLSVVRLRDIVPLIVEVLIPYIIPVIVKKVTNMNKNVSLFSEPI